MPARTGKKRPGHGFRRLGVVSLASFVLSVLLGSTSAVADGSQKHPLEDDPRVKAAVERGVTYLKKNIGDGAGGQAGLAALALLKAGEDLDTPEVKRVVDALQEKIRSGEYSSQGTGTIYAAGVHAMLLDAAGQARYRQEIQSIANYIIGRQQANGAWSYRTDGSGDTSVTQYAILGLWAAARSNARIPPVVWDRAAQWFVRTQHQDGSFSYNPDGRTRFAPSHSMTTAGASSLMVIKRHLYSEEASKNWNTPSPNRPQNGPKYGVLEKVDLQNPGKVGVQDRESTPDEKQPRNAPYNPRTSEAAVDSAIQGGLGWLEKLYTVSQPQGHAANRYPLYYLYGLERLAAFGELNRLAGNDWYADGAAHIVSLQKRDGHWNSSGCGSLPATSFALLFLTRGTAQSLGGREFDLAVGAGLLAGGRGLPENLATVTAEGGEIKARKATGPLDDLLAELANPQTRNLESTQSALVDKVRLQDREELIGQLDRLKKLAESPRIEVRRTAIWALGRSDDLSVVPLLIRALADSDVGVMVEAHKALCWLSRKTDGFGLPANPLAGVPEDAASAAKQAAIKAWQKEAVEKWRAWYQRVRPYEERETLERLAPASGR